MKGIFLTDIIFLAGSALCALFFPLHAATWKISYYHGSKMVSKIEYKSKEFTWPKFIETSNKLEILDDGELITIIHNNGGEPFITDNDGYSKINYPKLLETKIKLQHQLKNAWFFFADPRNQNNFSNDPKADCYANILTNMFKGDLAIISPSCVERWYTYFFKLVNKHYEQKYKQPVALSPSPEVLNNDSDLD